MDDYPVRSHRFPLRRQGVRSSSASSGLVLLLVLFSVWFVAVWLVLGSSPIGVVTGTLGSTSFPGPNTFLVYMACSFVLVGFMAAVFALFIGFGLDRLDEME